MITEILKQKIKAATKKAFLEIFEKHGEEEIYAFALYSDEGAMTVCPSSNTIKHLETADEDDFDYYKFSPAEWKYEMKGADAAFDEISALLRNELDKNEEDNKWFKVFQKQLFEICIATLEELNQENFFKQITGKDIFLIFSVSDYEFKTKDQKDIINRLNDNTYREEYLRWMKSW
jgi:Domain of unknown function (DUF4303)